MEFKENLTLERLPDAVSYLIGEIADIKTMLRNRPENSVPKYFSRKEVCEMWNISLPTLDRYLDKGLIVGSRVGHRIFFTQENIDNALHEIKKG